MPACFSDKQNNGLKLMRLLEMHNKESWWRERNGPKSGFISQRKMTTALVVRLVGLLFQVRVETPEI